MNKRELRRLPRGIVFTRAMLEEAKKISDVVVPVDKLVEYGESCNWLTRQGKPFKTISAFVNSYNGVWLQEQKNNSLFNFCDTKEDF